MINRQSRLAALNSETKKLEDQITQLAKSSRRYTNVRLLTFLAGGALSAVTTLNAGPITGAVVAILAIAGFAAAVFYHRRVENEIALANLRLTFEQAQIARLTLNWEAIPAAMPQPPNMEHPYALDLDLIGEHSLHQLMDTAVTLEGSQRLQDWMLHTKLDLDHISQQQARVQELIDMEAFRKRLYLAASQIKLEPGERWTGKRLIAWLQQAQNPDTLGKPLKILIPLCLLALVLVLLQLAGLVQDIWIFPWTAFMLYSSLQIRKHQSLFEDAFYLRDSLEKLNLLFAVLEEDEYVGKPSVEALCKPFRDKESAPSAYLKQVIRLVAAISLRKNPLLGMLLNFTMPWDIYFAYRLGLRKAELALLLPNWMDICFQLEALGSLANFAFLNPEMTFPQIVEPSGAESDEMLHVQEIGHPLIPAEKRVVNDFSISRDGSVNIVTGSNMAGKSTFLRTIGLNLALAFAGGPVQARSMKAGLFRLFTVVRLTDSVVDGFSYFYAEVFRLKALLMALDQEADLPVFFLVDEIFRGTNNRERLIGSTAYVKSLIRARGVGLIATHDLELVKLENEFSGIKNYHFRDDIVADRMVFDYKIHPGPCPTTNALKIMQLAGLPIS